MSDDESHDSRNDSTSSLDERASNEDWVHEGSDSRPQFSIGTFPNELGDEELISFDAQNDVVVFVGAKGRIIIRDMKNDSSPLVAQLKAPYRAFLSPNGHHCLVSTLDGDVHYYNVSQRKAIASRRVNADTGARTAMVIEAVAWDTEAASETSAASTGAVLLGSKAGGLIFSCAVTCTNGQAAFEYCRHVLQLPETDNAPVQGMSIVRNRKTHRTAVMVTTATRMHPFVGEMESAEAVLKLYSAGKTCEMTVMPGGAGSARGSLAVFQPKPTDEPVSFAWLSVSGVTHGLFAKKVSSKDVSDLRPADDSDDELIDEADEVEELFANQGHIPLRTALGDRFGAASAGVSRVPNKAPVDVCISAFHIYVLYDDALVVLGHPAGLTWHSLSAADLQDTDIEGRISFHPFEHRSVRGMLGIVRDATKRTVYAYNNLVVWEITTESEHAGQWVAFLELATNSHEDRQLRLRYFEAALKLSFGNSAARDRVTFAYGRFLMSIRAYEKAATILAHCSRFEAIYGLLRALRKPPLLLDYVEKRYRFLLQFRKKDAMRSQLVALFSILVHLKLEGINNAELSQHTDEEALDARREEFKTFLMTEIDRHLDAFKSPPVYAALGRLLTAHGRVGMMLSVAERLGHVPYTINHYISRRQYAEACDVLITKCSEATDENINRWYEFSPLLIQHCPYRLITGMLRFRTTFGGKSYCALDPERLLAAFVQYRPHMNEPTSAGTSSSDHQVIIFIERCIRKEGYYSTIVHNFYVSLLAEYDVLRLRPFLEQPDSVVAFEPAYALRQCIKFHRLQHCVPLYKRLGLYEEAVIIALESSAPDGGGNWKGLEVVESEILHERPHGMDSGTFKRLWLSVAARVIATLGTRDALTVVEHSRGVLKLEDILPYVGDNTVIQNFKQAIVQSLNEYARSIAALKQREEDAKRVSSSIKRESDALRHRFGYVSSKQSCQLCGKGIFTTGGEPFLVYPSCRHVFHEHCVVAKLEAMDGIAAFMEEEGLPQGYLDGVRTVHDLASIECIYCGESAIAEITRPLNSDASWSIE